MNSLPRGAVRIGTWGSWIRMHLVGAAGLVPLLTFVTGFRPAYYQFYSNLSPDSNQLTVFTDLYRHCVHIWLFKSLSFSQLTLLI